MIKIKDFLRSLVSRKFAARYEHNASAINICLSVPFVHHSLSSFKSLTADDAKICLLPVPVNVAKIHRRATEKLI